MINKYLRQKILENIINKYPRQTLQQQLSRLMEPEWEQVCRNIYFTYHRSVEIYSGYSEQLVAQVNYRHISTSREQRNIAKGTTDPRVTKVSCIGHITNSYIDLDQNSSSESRPSISSKILTKLQLQNLVPKKALHSFQQLLRHHQAVFIIHSHQVH